MAESQLAGGSAGAARPVGENGPQSRRLGTCWRPRAARWALLPVQVTALPKGGLDDGCVVQGASWATRVLMGGPSPDEAANRRARPMLNDSISSLFFLWSPTSFFLCFYMHASLCALPRVFYFLGARLEGRPGGYSGLQDDQLLLLSLLVPTGLSQQSKMMLTKQGTLLV